MDDAQEWLLAGDPSIRWQTMQDLLGSSEATVARERRKVAKEGWGARLLAKQDGEGRWAATPKSSAWLYSPKWTSTFYTMLLLRDLGVMPELRTRKPCGVLLDVGFRGDGGMNYSDWGSRSETCVTGMGLSILSSFRFDDDRLDTIAKHLLAEQMDDGGWNCRRPRGATHSSVHTTISALEGLRDYEFARGRNVRAVRAAQRRGREFLLRHHLFRSHRTGHVIKSEFTRFVFPPRWHYDVLRALDYFRSVNAPRDERLTEAIGMVKERRTPDGRWMLEHAWRGKTHFQLEKLGAPSRWNTLRALRVLRWWGPAGD